ncbi:uncharacterized protein [Engystomops pustulosus]|uniref:uncharacterized protein n=1 Tax=Engystomops pustulosus TaxID=76066 RepID=UPI003AFA6741
MAGRPEQSTAAPDAPSAIFMELLRQQCPQVYDYAIRGAREMEAENRQAPPTSVAPASAAPAAAPSAAPSSAPSAAPGDHRPPAAGDMDTGGSGAEDEEEPGRAKKARFTERETEILVEEVTQNYDHLFGRLADSIPLSAKHHIWQGITVRINGLGVEYRSVPEVRKKWYDCRRRLKAKLAKHKQSARRTGGGPSVAMRMSWVEQKISKTIHPDQTEGIGDFDTDNLDFGRAAPPTAPQAAPPPANEAAPGPPCASPATPPAVVSLGGSSGDEAPEAVPAEDRPITLGIFSSYMDKSLEAMGLIQQELRRHGRMMEEGFQLISRDFRALINILELLIHQGTAAQGGSVSVPPFSPPQVPTGGDPVTQASPAPESPIQLPTDQDSGCSYAPSLAGALDPSPVVLGPSPEATFLLSVKEELSSSASNPPGTSGSSVVTRRQAKRGKGPVRRSSRSSKP